MHDIVALIEEFILSSLLHKRVSLPRISKAEWILLGLAILLAATGLVYFAIALDGYLEMRFAPGPAALISGGLAFAVAIVLLFVRYVLEAKREKALARARSEIRADFSTLLRNIEASLDEPIRENPKLSIAIAALSGFFAVKEHTHH